MPAASEPDALNNDALDDDITNSIGDLRIELSVEDDATTRDDFVGTVFLGSCVNLPTEDIVKAWNNQGENDDKQDIVNAFVDEVCEDIATMELAQAESAYAHSRGLENIAANADAKETA